MQSTQHSGGAAALVCSPSLLRCQRHPPTPSLLVVYHLQALAVVDAAGALLKSVVLVLDGEAGTAFEASHAALLAGVADAVSFMAPVGPTPYEATGTRSAGGQQEGQLISSAIIKFYFLPLAERRGAPKFRRPEAWREVRDGGQAGEWAGERVGWDLPALAQMGVAAAAVFNKLLGLHSKPDAAFYRLIGVSAWRAN